MKVLIVDDSRIFRSLIQEVLEGLPDVEVIGSVWNGIKALEFLREKKPDIISLDLEMPEMNGLETLKEIAHINASLPGKEKIGVIIVSSLSFAGAAITLKALELGAFDFVIKPARPTSEENFDVLRKELSAKFNAFWSRRGSCSAPTPRPAFSQPLSPPKRSEKRNRFRAIVIGASTGGPKALGTLLPNLSKVVDLPILIAVHMPPFFTQTLAESFNNRCPNHKVMECKGIEVLENKVVYLAPGGKHLVLRDDDKGQIMATLTTQPPEDGCCPSVNVLFRSAAKVFGGDVIALILTGMGADGTKGLGPLKRAGAFVIAQDEETSVVWGMPGNAVASGLVDKIVPLEKIPSCIDFQIQLEKGNT